MNGQDPKLTAGQPSQPKPLPVKFIHKDGKGFQTVHADGIWGMLNGQRNIQINFFTERPPIPDSVTFPIQPDGQSFTGQILEEYKERDDKNFIVIREFQVGAIMSLAAAKHVHTVLGNFIAMAEDQEKLAAQMQAKTAKTT